MIWRLSHVMSAGGVDFSVFFCLCPIPYYINKNMNIIFVLYIYENL